MQGKCRYRVCMAVISPGDKKLSLRNTASLMFSALESMVRALVKVSELETAEVQA